MSVIPPEDPKTLTCICQPLMVNNTDEDITVNSPSWGGVGMIT